MRTVLLILFLIVSAVVRAQQPFSRDLWLNESATPEKVNALVQDNNGYLWLGTDIGLFRFNGRTFTRVEDSIYKPVTAIVCDGQTIYAGYKDGSISRFYKGGSSVLNYAGPKPASAITSLATQFGCLWVGSEAQGIFAILNGRSCNFSTADGLTDNFIYSLRFVAPGRLLASTDQGVNVLQFAPDGRIRVSPLFDKGALPDNIVRVLRPVHDSLDKLWAGMEDKGICRIEGNIPFAFMKDWKWGQLNDIMPLSGTHAWAATQSGYLLDCYYKPDGTYEVKPYYFEGKKFNKLLQDPSGNIWCATDAGLTMITDNFLSFKRMAGAYSLKSLSATACDSNNTLFYAIGNDLYAQPLLSDAPSQKVFSATAPITSLFEDASNRLWIGTLGGGLWCKCSVRVQPVVGLSGITGGHILNISGIDDKLWVSSLNGVEELKINPDDPASPLLIRHHGKQTGSGSDYVYQLFPDSKKRMWMATDGAGIIMWDGATYHTWDSSAGFPSKVVYSITEDATGAIWAATLGDGLFSYNGNGWKSISTRHGLMDLNISTLAANATGQIVAVHLKGMDEWYSGSNEFRHYNRRLGMDIDSESTTLNCYASDTAGNIWVPFEHGFICFHNLEHQYDIRPNIQINEVSLFFKPVLRRRNAFTAEENYIGFRYEGINFSNPERLYYRYMLEGYDNTWVSTNDETIVFPRLPAGHYKFRVQTALNNFFYGAAEASYSFKIATPIWKRPWAIALMILILAAVAYTYMRVRERNLRRLAMLQRERMMFEYEHLKSQVNPHFLFNSLNTLASLIEEDQDMAVNYTVELSDLYRNMLAFRNMDLIPLEEEWSLLKKYFYVQQSRFSSALNLEDNIPANLLTEKKIIPLALQLLVENAIKHNVVSKDSPLVIYIEATGNTITVRNKIQPKMSKEKSTGIGLANIKKRYALLTKLPVYYGREDGYFIVILPLI